MKHFHDYVCSVYVEVYSLGSSIGLGYFNCFSFENNPWSLGSFDWFIFSLISIGGFWVEDTAMS